MDVDTEVHNTKVKDLDADVDSNKSEGVLKAKTTLQKPGSHIDAEEKYAPFVPSSFDRTETFTRYFLS